MIVPNIDIEICEHLHELPFEQQQRVLEFVRTLTTQSHIIAKHSLLSFVGAIDKNDLFDMQQAISNECEQTHDHDW